MEWEARSQYRGKPVEENLAVRISLFWPTKRNRDVDNIKGALDSMTGILWKDDGQIVDLRITKAYDKENPRMELELSTVQTIDSAI